MGKSLLNSLLESCRPSTLKTRVRSWNWHRLMVSFWSCISFVGLVRPNWNIRWWHDWVQLYSIASKIILYDMLSHYYIIMFMLCTSLTVQAMPFHVKAWKQAFRQNGHVWLYVHDWSIVITSCCDLLFFLHSAAVLDLQDALIIHLVPLRQQFWKSLDPSLLLT